MALFNPDIPSFPQEVIEAAREAIAGVDRPKAEVRVFQYEEEPELGFGVELLVEGVVVVTLEPGKHTDGPVRDVEVALAFGELMKDTLAKALKQ